MKYVIPLLCLIIGFGAGMYSPIIRHLTKIETTQEETEERLVNLEDKANMTYNALADMRYRIRFALDGVENLEIKVNQIKVDKSVRVIIEGN